MIMNIRIIFVFALSIFSMQLNQATAQTCASPTPLTFGVPANNLTTCGLGNPFDQEDACGNTFMNGEDYVFSYTPTTVGLNDCVSINLTALTPPTAKRAIFVFDGCPDLAGTNCIAQVVFTGTGNPNINISNLQLTVGTPYMIVVSNNFLCHSFNIAVSGGACTPP